MDNYSISSFPDQEAERSSLIKVKGELSIQYIKDIKKQLDEVIKDLDHIDLLIHEASIIDLSMLQYLLSLKKSAESLGKTFSISFELDEDLNELLEHAGFKNLEKLAE
jgi:anti-anti-sigma regulatory factor